MEQFDPKPTLDIEVQKKQALWDKTISGLDEIGDGLGYRIDPGIKEMVTAFIVNGFPTYGSCEGHVEERFNEMIKLRPYIAVGLDEPQQRFVDEAEIKNSIAVKFNIPVEQVEENEASNKAYWDYIHEQDTPETSEFLAIREKNTELEKNFLEILKLFYENRKVPEQIKLITEQIGPAGHFHVTTATENPEEVKNTDLEKYRQELLLEQEKIKAFKQFLKERFFASKKGF